MKTLDLNKSVYELTQEYPEVVKIMASLGFTEITKKAMLHSVGRVMTIPKGAAVKGIPMEKIVAEFKEHGFNVADGTSAEHQTISGSTMEQPEGRIAQLKAYLRRLGEGEDLESVRKDFVSKFSDVDAREIMDAEQQLMAEGIPLEEVQRLCDVHSALFHGTTGCESHSSAPEGEGTASGRSDSVAENEKFTALILAGIKGHPLHTFTKENEAIQAVIDKWKAEKNFDTFRRIHEVGIHYDKKGDLIYTLLKVKYDITGPHSVMWTVDDEIRHEVSLLVKEHDEMPNDVWLTRADAVIERIEEMIYKETNILFPICAEHFTDEEWRGIYRDSKAYASCLGVENEVWDEATSDSTKSEKSDKSNEIIFPSGHLTLPQLTALLNTIPMEISFIDVDNINRYFNEGFKVFKRPAMALDRDVFSCHPPKIQPMVRSIIDSFRSGRADRLQEWVEKDGHLMLVQYMAVRDPHGNYIGTVELDQNMDIAREYFAQTEKILEKTANTMDV